MKIYIYPSLFNNDLAWHDLDRLFILIEDRRYEWLIKNENDLTDFVNSTYLDAQPEYKYNIYRELAESTFSKANTEGGNHKETVIEIQTLDNLSYNLLFLNQPLYIILENIENDKYFLDALFRCFKKPSKKIIRHIEFKWIEFLHAGGKDGVIPNIRGRQGRIRTRIFILLDSDKKLPNEPYSGNLTRILEFCASTHAICHTTYKREIENYLPDTVLSTLTNADQRSVYDAYAQLSSEQKDFYDLEKGFNDRGTAVGQEPLFEGVRDFQNLRKGFALNKRFDTKKDFPRLFNNETYVTQEALNTRCAHQPNPNELRDLLDTISRLI